MSTLVPTAPIPDMDSATVVVPAPGDGPGHWAGAPSAWLPELETLGRLGSAKALNQHR